MPHFGRIITGCVVLLVTQAIVNYVNFLSLQAQGEDRAPHLTHTKSVLVVVPGLGDIERIETLQKSITAISKSLERDEYKFDCLVYVWNANILENVTEALQSHCQIHFNRGLWTHHMAKVPPTNASHVAILMDDVDASKVDMIETLVVMEQSGFGAASPAVDDPTYPFTSRRANCLSHRTDFVNVFFTIMSTPVWQCWQSNIDITINGHGWGMDMALSDLCNTTIGVIDDYEIVHTQEGSTSYSISKAELEMNSWIQSRTGKEPSAYWRCTSRIEGRPTLFDECLMYQNGTKLQYDAEANEKFRSLCWDQSNGTRVTNETR